jgi:hypothetical protein
MGTALTADELTREFEYTRRAYTLSKSPDRLTILADVDAKGIAAELIR